MKIRMLAREALAAAWASKVPSALVCLICAAMCMMTIATVGRTAAAEEQVAERINSAGARELVITDKNAAGLINGSLINMTAKLSVVDRAVGLQAPVDVINTLIGAGADPVPAWGIIGDLGNVAVLNSGRMPGPGEALVSSTALRDLGLQKPVGAVTLINAQVPLDYAVVGSFSAREPFDNLSQGVIINAANASSVASLHTILTDSSQAQAAQRTVIGLLGSLPDSEAISVRSPMQMAQLQDEIIGDLGSFGRALLYGSLGIGALLVGIVVFADILVRRKDLGRRRALGASRSTIISLMLLRTLVPAAVGGLIGIVGGLMIAAQSGAMPPVSFSVGVMLLAMIAAGLSALVPASIAAHSDPVKVLRTP